MAPDYRQAAAAGARHSPLRRASPGEKNGKQVKF